MVAILDGPIGIKNIKFVEDLPIWSFLGSLVSTVLVVSEKKRFETLDPIGSNVKLSPAVTAILNFISEQKTWTVCRRPNCQWMIHCTVWLYKVCVFYADRKLNIFHHSRSIWLIIWTCGGGHLGIPIGIKNYTPYRGPSNDHSWACLVSIIQVVLREEAFWNIFCLGSNVKLKSCRLRQPFWI